MRCKRGLSPVIAVVLLLAITVVAATIIVAFILPFVNKNLEEGGECFDILGDLSFGSTPYNCYTAVGTSGKTGFSVRVTNEDVTGFRIALISSGDANSYEIPGYSDSDILMLSGETPPVAPGDGETRTYVYQAGSADRAELYPILGSRKCGLADEIIFDRCLDLEIIADINGADINGGTPAP